MMTSEMQYQNPLISVIIPIYNVEVFLRECLDSVLDQTYRNLEIILIDDGSSDKCGAICDEYAGKDSRIKVIHKENGGLSDARNAGLDICTGDFISFVDSDDFIHPKFIETLLNAILTTDADISMCFFTSENFVESSEMEKTNILDFVEHEAINLPTKFVVWNKLYPRKYWEDNRFVKGVKHEDVCAFSFIFEYKSIALLQSQLYHYRNREESITAKPSKESLKDLSDAVEFLESKVPKNCKKFRRKLFQGRILQLTRRVSMFNDQEAKVKIRKNIYKIVEDPQVLTWKEKTMVILKSLF